MLFGGRPLCLQSALCCFRGHRPIIVFHQGVHPLRGMDGFASLHDKKASRPSLLSTTTYCIVTSVVLHSHCTAMHCTATTCTALLGPLQLS